jgi:DNA polymerase-1
MTQIIQDFSGVVIADCEANGLLDTVNTVWCIVIKDIINDKVYKFRPEEIDEALKLFDRCKLVAGHSFIDYDVPLLQQIKGYTFPKNCVILDTYIISQMISPDRKKHPRTAGKKGPHSLENFGNIFKRYKPEHEDWTQFSEDMLHRCVEDVEINHLTYSLLNRSSQLVNKDGTLDKDSVWYMPYKIESKFAEHLVKQKRKGFLLNIRRTKKYIQYLTAKIDAIDEEIVPLLPKQLIIEEQKDDDGQLKYNKKPFKGNGELNKHTLDWCARVGFENTDVVVGPFSRVLFQPFDLGSAAMVKDYLLEHGWIPEEWNTKRDPVTGAFKRTSPKLSQTDNFLGVEGKIGQEVAKRLVFRHRRSQLEGFLKYVREDGRITSDVTGLTPTARLKHAKVVNVPGSDAIFGNQMRSVFTVPDGYRLVGCDAASCQLRDLCNHMGDDAYTDAVVNGDSKLGTDVHTLTMNMTGLPSRTAAKRFVYGSLFGAGLPKLAAMMEVGVKLARSAKSKFFKNLPKYGELVKGLEVLFKQRGYIIGADGRHIFPRSAHQTLCYQLQSDEAIGMKVAYIYLCNWITEEGLDAWPVCMMHDEFQVEVREDHAKRVAELAELSIAKAHQWLKFKVPFAGEADIGKTWKDTH